MDDVPHQHTVTDKKGGRSISGELSFRQTALHLQTKWVCAVKERAGRRIPLRLYIGARF